MQKFVEVACANPARLYGLDKKGSIALGYDANVVIWYRDAEFAAFELTNRMLHHNIDHTPYEGIEFRNWPRYRLIRGSIVFARDEGGIAGEITHGKFVKRSKAGLRQPKNKFENEWRPQYKGQVPGSNN